MRLVILALLLVVGSGCYRTHYENFSPANPMRAADAPPTYVGKRGWTHFFIWGWVPAEEFIDARAICGGPENVHAIETRRTFLEGLVAAFAGYYINIYSPWDAKVICRRPAPPAVATP
jgi:hypothetical protein